MKTVARIKLLAVLIFILFAVSGNYVLASELRLNADSNTFFLDQSNQVTIHLLPDGSEVVGVDIFLNYDPLIFSIKQIRNLGVFENVSAQEINNEAGWIKLALSNTVGKYQTNNADIAVLEINALALSDGSKINFSYQPGNTKDTNVAARGGVDSLKGVTGIEISVSESNVLGAQNKSTIVKDEAKNTEKNENDKNDKDENEVSGSYAGIDKEKRNKTVAEKEGDTLGLSDEIQKVSEFPIMIALVIIFSALLVLLLVYKFTVIIKDQRKK